MSNTTTVFAHSPVCQCCGDRGAETTGMCDLCDLRMHGKTDGPSHNEAARMFAKLQAQAEKEKGRGWL